MTRISRLLIANRGEIALRIIRTAHRMGVQTVAIYSDADRHAMHVREASAAHAIGGMVSADSYLRIDKIIKAARATNADAVHPGYGFLSENADFAQAVVDAGLLWVGPPASAIRALGSKSSVKQIAIARGVPCLPAYWGADQSDARFASEAERIGFPVMVKAAAGGGGRGMRLVSDSSQLVAALQSARSEALAGFGSDELLLERALIAPRHVEVQIFADSHGHCIHLGERDCSVQRRHQKIIEESPSPAVDEDLRKQMGDAAIGLAKAAGYVGAGTVEFLLQGREFFLMEMNTRLQVEHPVTEAVTGLDLVECQLRVVQGEPLPLAQDDVRFDGHAIEVRLCAEDENFVPHSGRVIHFRAPANGVRFDHALEAGAEVSPYYDSMLGKLVAHGATRAEAIGRLAFALDQTEVLGIATNRQFLAACLRDETFARGEASIAFIGERADSIRATLEAQERAALIPAALATMFDNRDDSRGLAPPFARPVVLRHRGEVTRFSVREIAAGVVDVDRAGEHERMLLARTASARLPNGAWHVQQGSVDIVFEDASFDARGASASSTTSNELRAPFNGKVIAVKVASGQHVARGDTLLVIESMKLEHALCALRDATIASVHVEPGQQAATSQVLVRFE